MTPWNNSKQPLRRLAILATFFLSSAPFALAVSTSANGIYSGSGTSTQVLVVSGRPVSNAVLNNHQQFVTTFTETTNGLLDGSIDVKYSFVETKGKSTFTVSYYSGTDGSLLLTFSSVLTVTVLQDTSTSFRTRTQWVMSMDGEALGGRTELSNETITESYTFNISSLTCIYVFNGGAHITLKRIGTGSGASQGSPLIPNNPNWSTSTTLGFPIIKPNSTIFCDPPFATSFEYKIAPGRKELFSSITLPKGFGKKIEVLAQPSKGGALVKVGSFNSGAKINLTSKSAFKKGTRYFVIRKISPKVDLKKKAPYPVGVTFSGLTQSAAKILIKGKS